LHKLRTRTQLAHTRRRQKGSRSEGANEWKENRARAARTIINDHRLVLSSSHSCILDKSNVAQLTETNCREWSWVRLFMHVCWAASELYVWAYVYVCVRMCMCMCVHRVVSKADDAQVDISKRSRCTIEL